MSSRFFFFLPVSSLSSSKAASVAILPSALFYRAIYRSVQVGRPHFSRCCYLIIDLGSHLFKRKLGQELVAVT